MVNKTETKQIERTYVVPLRKEWMKVPRYKRTNKAIKALRAFISKHMKVSLENIKLDDLVNKFIWQNSIKSPPAKIMINVKLESKDDKTFAMVKLADSEKEKIKHRLRKPVFVRATPKPKEKPKAKPKPKSVKQSTKQEQENKPSPKPEPKQPKPQKEKEKEKETTEKTTETQKKEKVEKTESK